MGTAKYPSVVTMPAAEKPYPSIVEFLFTTFPNVPQNRWAERILEGKVLSDTGSPITAETMYAPSKRLFDVVAIAHAVVAQDVAVVPEFLDDRGGSHLC